MPNISSAIAVIGDSGSGKSVLLSTYALWVWEKFKLRSRLYSFDLAGWSAEMQALIDVGIVEAWRVRMRDPDGSRMLISETILRACQGWWPAEIDPSSGETPGGVMIRPLPAGWKGAVLYDGMTSMCAWSMTEMGARAAKGILGGEAGNMKTVESGDVKLSMGNRGSVGFTQNKAMEWIAFANSIPGLVAPAVFTCLEMRVLDDDTKLPLYGPQLAGKAKAAEALSWFGPKLGALGPIDVKEGGEVKQEYRLYLRDYCWPATDPTPHKCDARVGASPRGKLPAYLTDGPGNGSLEKFNLGYFMELREQLQEEARAAYAAKLEGAPGLGESTIGKATSAAAPAVVAAGGGAQAVSAPPTPGGPTPGPRLHPRAAAMRGAAPVATPAPAPAPAPPAQVQAPAPVPEKAPEAEPKSSGGEKPASAGSAEAKTPPVAAAAQTPVAGRRFAPPGARPPARAPVAIPPKKS